MAPKGFSVEMLIEKYSGKRFGSWIVGKNFYRKSCCWHVDVLCDCGKTQNVTIAALAVHKGCSCAYLDKVYENKIRSRQKTELEMIWPAVIKAGRQVMEKYKNEVAIV